MKFAQKVQEKVRVENSRGFWKFGNIIKKVVNKLGKSSGKKIGSNYLAYILNLHTGQKIIGLFVVMAIFLSAVGTIGYYYIGEMSSQILEVSSHNLLSVKWLSEIHANIGATEAAVTRVVNPLTIDQFFIDEKVAEIKKREGVIEKLIANYKNLHLSEFESNRIPLLEQELRSYNSEVQKVVALTLAGRKPEAYAYFTQNAKPHLDAASGLLLEITDYSSRQAEYINLRCQEEAKIAKNTVLGASLMAIVLAVVLGVWLSRFTASRLKKVKTSLNEVARGNLQVEELAIVAKDDIGLIAQDVNQMVASLRSIMSRVAGAAKQVEASSSEVIGHATQSSEIINQVASAIGEVAADAKGQIEAVDQTSLNIEQMTVRMKQIAENTSCLVELSGESAEAAKAGDTAIDKAISQINSVERIVTDTAKVVDKLGQRSKDIGAIVTVISKIAEHTNLLALNAAIEAARAGEHGRGFTIVAEEVRKLADQSAQATKQIVGLIAEIQSDTREAVDAMNQGTQAAAGGATVVDLAGVAFRDIATLVEQVSFQVQGISRSIQEAAGDSKKIVDSIANIEKASNQTARQSEMMSTTTEEQLASMEDITISSKNLAMTAAELQTAIKQFIL